MSNENKQHDERAECAHDYVRTDGVCTECGGSATITCSSKHCPQAAQARRRGADADMRAAFLNQLGEPWETALDAKRRIWSIAWGTARATQQATKGDERAAPSDGRILAYWLQRHKGLDEPITFDAAVINFARTLLADFGRATTPSPVAGSAGQAPTDVLERELFEGWAMSEFELAALPTRAGLGYRLSGVDDAWAGWQGAWKKRAPTAPSLATDAGAVLTTLQIAEIARRFEHPSDFGGKLDWLGFARAVLAAHPTEQRMSDAATCNRGVGCDGLGECFAAHHAGSTKCGRDAEIERSDSAGDK